MGNLSRKRRLVGAAVTLLVLGAVGLVYAAWTTNGSGNGFAKAGTAQNLTTVDPTAVTTGLLYPSGSGDVALTIHNPNPYPVQVTAVTNGSGSIAGSGGTGTCTTTGVTFTNQTGLTINVPNSTTDTGDGNGNKKVVLPNAASMSNASDNGCQGATFTIPVSLAGASN